MLASNTLSEELLSLAATSWEGTCPKMFGEDPMKIYDYMKIPWFIAVYHHYLH